jgi:hypothetical protein
MIYARCPNCCVLRALQQLGPNAAILDSRAGFVSGSVVPEDVYLIGVKPEGPTSLFAENITLVIAQRCSNYCTVTPLNQSGYEPRIALVDLTGNGIDNIYVSIASGGSGGMAFYYIYSYEGCRLRLIFDYEDFNESSLYTVEYKDNYMVQVTQVGTGQSWLISLRCRDRNYLCEIYNPDGTLKAPITGWVNPLGGLQPRLAYHGRHYDLWADQSIAGRYNADGLGTVFTHLVWQNGAFVVSDVYVTAGYGCQDPDLDPEPCAGTAVKLVRAPGRPIMHPPPPV